MSGNKIMKQWKKSSIAIGSPTNILAALTSFIPVIWLCTTYGRWSSISTVLTAWGMVAVSFGAFYLAEPVSYYVVLGMTGTYLSFLSGNIGDVRVPYAALTLDVIHSTPGTIQIEVVSIVAICGSIVTNLTGITSAVVVGGTVLSVLPEFVVVGFTKYASSVVFGVTFGNFTVRYPKAVVFALAIPVIPKMTTGLPIAAVIVCTVSSTLLVAGVFYEKRLVRQS